MATNGLTEDQIRATTEALKLTRNSDGTNNIVRAAEVLQLPRSTVQSRIKILKRLEALKEKEVEFPEFITNGDEEEPIEEILSRLQKAQELKTKATEARRWFKINVKETKPYGILWFGDPHLGPSCNWTALNRDIRIANLPGVYGGNIGDTTNNWPWTGKLARLWAEDDISKYTERRVATWFMLEAGIKWLCWIGGNHDEWNGGTDFYKMIGAKEIPVIDWRARFTLCHRSGRDVRVDAAHGRKGTSIYNPAHGTLRDAKFGEEAALFISGHIHSFGLFHIEFPERRTKAWLAQVAGYKVNDRHALVNGYAESQDGESILSIIDPATGKIVCFGDTEEGAQYLTWLRAR